MRPINNSHIESQSREQGRDASNLILFVVAHPEDILLQRRLLRGS